MEFVFRILLTEEQLRILENPAAKAYVDRELARALSRAWQVPFSEFSHEDVTTQSQSAERPREV